MTVQSTAQLRDEYGPHCSERTRQGAQEAWDAHQAVMRAFGYQLRAGDTGSRSCRAITGGTNYSLHAFFIACVIHLWNLARSIAAAVAGDFNWQTNPYGPRLVTDMPRAMVDAICALRTRSGAQVFRWGGYYAGNKDAMHFEIVCTPTDLATGIDPRTLPGAVTAQEANPANLFEETDMLRLLICNPGRDDWPEIKGHWFKSDGLTAVHVPTKGHATALVGLGLLKEDDPVPVSPNLLRELGATPPTV